MLLEHCKLYIDVRLKNQALQRGVRGRLYAKHVREWQNRIGSNLSLDNGNQLPQPSPSPPPLSVFLFLSSFVNIMSTAQVAHLTAAQIRRERSKDLPFVLTARVGGVRFSKRVGKGMREVGWGVRMLSSWEFSSVPGLQRSWCEHTHTYFNLSAQLSVGVQFRNNQSRDKWANYLFINRDT